MTHRRRSWRLPSLPEAFRAWEQLHLLPYHRLGQDKYAGLGREYLMSHIEPPANEHMEMLREVAATTGLHVQVGG